MKTGKTLTRLFGTAAAALMLAGMLLLASCVPMVAGELPASHLDEQQNVDWAHARCGACHMGGERLEE